MTTVPQAADRWRKSSRSAAESACIELSPLRKVRDSKNPDGPVLPVDLGPLLAAVKTGRLG